MQLNDISFAGFVGRDAETKVTQNNAKIVNFNLCHTLKGKDGRADVSTWVRVKVFGAWAETASSLKKGDNVFVKGSLNVTEYTNKEGVKKTMVEISAFNLAVLKTDARPDKKEEISKAQLDDYDLDSIPF
jgi:single-strand DNA-binding protein